MYFYSLRKHLQFNAKALLRPSPTLTFTRNTAHKPSSSQTKQIKVESSVEIINITTPLPMRSATCFLVGMACKLFLKLACSQVHLRNFDRLLKQVESRAPGTSLITIQNHATTLDDPILWGTLPTHFLAAPRLVRWSLAAKEIIFINPLFNAFFAAGQTIPIIRGAGIYQPAIDAALELLNKNGWINIYPEGKVNRDKPLLPFKWGVGRLIQETVSTPIIIPIYHSGMLNIYPGDGVIFPQIGKQLVVSVGSPINIRELLKDDADFQNISPDDTDRARSYITNVVKIQLDDLRKETLAWMQEKGIKSGFRPNK